MARPLRAGERGRTVTYRKLGVKPFELGSVVRAVIVGPYPATTRILVTASPVEGDEKAARITTASNPFPTVGNYDTTLEVVDGSNVMQLSGEPVRLSVKPAL